jgi:hypothetical protein
MPDNLIVRQTPQRQRLAGGAGDAVGILRGASGKTNAVDFSAVRSRRLEVLEAASNAFLGEERFPLLERPKGVLHAFKTACARIGVRTGGPLAIDRPHELLPTPAPVPASVFWKDIAHPPERISMRTGNI